MPRSIDKYFIHVVQILRGPVGVAGTGTDKYGEPLEAATPETLTVNCRVEFDNRRVMTIEGEEKVAYASIFFANSYDAVGNGDYADYTELYLGIQDQIIFEGRAHPILKIERHEAWGWQPDSRSHFEVWIA